MWVGRFTDFLLDGWDIYRSSYVTIQDSTVNNDDDCVCEQSTPDPTCSPLTTGHGPSVQAELDQHRRAEHVVQRLARHLRRQPRAGAPRPRLSR